MKFCHNCGFPLDGKTICTCGYNVETGEINKDVNDEYNRSFDNMNSFINNGFSMMTNNNINNQYDNMTSKDLEDIMNNAKKMGIDTNVTDTDLNNTIFNKDNDSIKNDFNK